MIPVEGHKGLYRDEFTGAIVNLNVNEYEDYIHLKNKKLEEQNEILYLKNEIEELKLLIRNSLSK